MFLDRIRAALAPLRELPPAVRRAALARAPAARRLASAAASAAVAGWAATRRRPDAVLAVALLLGVFLMVLHWKGSPIDPEAGRREAGQQHAIAGP